MEFEITGAENINKHFGDNVLNADTPQLVTLIFL